MKTLIAYFGSYGSGNNLTDILCEAAKKAGDEVYLQGPRTSKKFFKFSPVSVFLTRKALLKRAYDLDIELVIFPMSNPIDLFLGRALRKKKIKCVRLIHEIKRHPGDLYPPTWLARRILKDADGVVCLSQFVRRQIEEVNQNIPIIKASHPYYFPLVSEESTLREPAERRILFIGRNSKYKGLSLLLNAWPSIGVSSNTLTIAGEHKPKSKDIRVKQLNGWLSDLHFHQLVNSHDLLVFPYTEASQSGIIPLSIQYKKPVIVLPVGGLPEQVKHLSNGLVARGLTTQDFIEAVNCGLKREWKLETVDLLKSHLEFYKAFKEVISLIHGVD